VRHQQVILVGVFVWLTGCYLDSKLLQYAYLLIILGTIISFAGAFDWLRIKENRKRLKETISLKRDLIENIKQAFDFSWRRVSVIWTCCALFGMLIVHIGSLVLKSTGAYKCAVQEIRMSKSILQQIGEIKGFSYMITGHTTSGNGFSELNIGVIGTNKSLNIKAEIEGVNGAYVPSKILIED
jgi:hypothetical protein